MDAKFHRERKRNIKRDNNDLDVTKLNQTPLYIIHAFFVLLILVSNKQNINEHEKIKNNIIFFIFVYLRVNFDDSFCKNVVAFV